MSKQKCIHVLEDSLGVFSLKLHTIKSGWPIVYIQGSRYSLQKKKYCISFLED